MSITATLINVVVPVAINGVTTLVTLQYGSASGPGSGGGGADGLSSYEVALLGGFVGTQADWLASLVGPQGPAGSPAEQGEIVLAVDGGGVVPIAGVRRRRIERNCTILSASIAANASGSVSVTFKRDRAGVIVTLGTIALAAAQDIRDTTLTGWTTDLLAGDILIGEYGAATTLTVYAVTLGRGAA